MLIPCLHHLQVIQWKEGDGKDHQYTTCQTAEQSSSSRRDIELVNHDTENCNQTPVAEPGSYVMGVKLTKLQAGIGVKGVPRHFITFVMYNSC